MSEELICITCPMGCRLSVDRQADGGLSVTGNRCPRGIKYANEELLAPRRVVSATATVLDGEAGRLPVRSASAYPKQDVPELLAAIYALRVPLPVKRGDVLIKDFKGSGVDVIATRTIDKIG